MRCDVAAFSLGQIVYHKVDEDPGVVVGVCFRDVGVLYQIVWTGRVLDWHCELELSAERVYVGGSKGDAEA